MFSSNKKGMRLPSPPRPRGSSQQERRDEIGHPLPNSLFPQYSSSLPEFECGFANNAGDYRNGEESADFSRPVDPHAMSDGTPVTIQVNKFSRTPDAAKHFPLHVQTAETMSEDEEDFVITDPSEFPYYRPPARTLIQAFYANYASQGANTTVQSTTDGVNEDQITEKVTNDKDQEVKPDNPLWAKYRLRIVLSFFLLLLILIIAIPVTASRKKRSNSSTSTSSSLQDLFNTDAPTMITGAGGNALAPVPLIPAEPMFPRPTLAPTSAPTLAAITTLPPTLIPSTPPTRPVAQLIATPAPTMSRDHPMVNLLQSSTPLEILMNPYTPQGKALAWLSTKDQHTFVSEDQLIQRYALTVLDVSLHDPEPRLWSSRNLHECQWPGVTCNDDMLVTGINWARQGLSGTIPPELGLLTNLITLDIAQNQLKGQLQTIYPLENLKFAYLFENSLTGTLSREIENCRNLTRLFAGHNELSGSIPSGLKMRPLEWFVMHFNLMTGTIPEDISFGLNTVFDISHNRFIGKIPEVLALEDGILPNIRHLHLDHNQFTGSIPGSFVQLGKGRLRQLYLNDNKFSGAFPDNWLTVKLLNNIDISNNNFRANLDGMCRMSVFEYGELVEMRADCDICNCDRLCRICRDNKDFKYEYEDDGWIFDDDTV